MKFEIQRKSIVVPNWWVSYDTAESLLEAMEKMIKHAEDQVYEDFRIKTPLGEYHYEKMEIVERRRNEKRKQETLKQFIRGNIK